MLSLHLLPVPAAFDEGYRGPALPLRSARILCGGGPAPCFAEGSGGESAATVVVEPFSLRCWPGTDQALALSNEELLKLTSTSPMQEQPRFASDMRETLRMMLEAAGDENAEGAARDRLFPSGQALRFPFPDAY